LTAAKLKIVARMAAHAFTPPIPKPPVRQVNPVRAFSLEQHRESRQRRIKGAAECLRIAAIS
jgi:hypothetical protein